MFIRAPHRIVPKRLTLLATAMTAAFSLQSSQALASYVQTNLVTDDQASLIASGFAPAQHVDPNLINPWGLAVSASGPFWAANNGSNNATLYNGQGQSFPIGSPLIVNVAPTNSAPTGQVFNGGSGFQLINGNTATPARFIFASESGHLSGWNPAVNPTLAVTTYNASDDAIYKGLAIATDPTGSHLYASDFHNGKIDVFDENFSRVSLSGSFVDPTLPAGYAPFNVQSINGLLYVTYALQDADKEDDVQGAGLGLISVFDSQGNFLKRLASNGPLNSPWGLALAPSDFGEFSNALLVGNFGDGLINAYNPDTNALLGQLSDANGDPLSIPGLWALGFGNDGLAGAHNQLFFTAGINDEEHGLFGRVSVPEPASLALLGSGLLGLGLRRKSRDQGDAGISD